MIKHSIVLVPFPFDDLTSIKVRPALCLTSETTEHDHIIIAFISNRIPDNPEDSDLIIFKESKHWIGTGLAVDSVIRLHRLMTIPKNLVKRKLGRISNETAGTVVDKLNSMFRNENH